MYSTNGAYQLLITLLHAGVPREAGTERVDCWDCDSGIWKTIPILHGMHRVLVVISFCMWHYVCFCVWSARATCCLSWCYITCYSSIARSSWPILYIIVSLCNLLCSSDDHPRSCSILVGLDLFLCLFSTYLADLLCTFSSWCISFWVWRSHTIGAYSIRGQIRALYAIVFIQGDSTWRLRRRKLSIWLALVIILLMW